MPRGAPALRTSSKSAVSGNDTSAHSASSNKPARRRIRTTSSLVVCTVLLLEPKCADDQRHAYDVTPMRRPIDTAGENPHTGMGERRGGITRGLSFGPDVSAQSDNPLKGDAVMQAITARLRSCA